MQMENPKGWGILFQIPSVVGVWIFSGNTQLRFVVLNYFLLYILVSYGQRMLTP